MGKTSLLWRLTAPLVAFGLLAAACGSDSGTSADGSSTTAAGGSGTTAAGSASTKAGGDQAASGKLTPVSLQLQWFTQAQFAGYYAALDQGYYKDAGLDVKILEGGVDIVPATVLASGGADFAVSWVPRGLVPREEGTNITNIAQVFQRSATLQVSLADSGINSVADLKGKKVGNWGFGNEFELLAGLRSAGLDPAKDVSLLQQKFDMLALLSGEIDAAQAMTYNEYAQVLETENPKTGKLYQPEDLHVINWNKEGTAMLQDALWADADRLKSDTAYKETAVKFVEASLKGWIYCRDNADACVKIVLDAAPTLGQSHQAWMLNEVNALIWPSPQGVGITDKGLWDQTVKIALDQKVLKAAPTDGAYVSDVAEEAVKNLKANGIDVTGANFKKTTVTLNKGGE
jgi:NitT/TauT family transport system substrate-binding protein